MAGTFIRRRVGARPYEAISLDLGNPLSSGVYEAWAAGNGNNFSALGTRLSYTATKATYFAPGTNVNGPYIGNGATNVSTRVYGKSGTVPASQSITLSALISPGSYTAGGSDAYVAICPNYFGLAAYDGAGASKFSAVARYSGGVLTHYVQDSATYDLGKSYMVSAVLSIGTGISLWVNGRSVGFVADTRKLIVDTTGAVVYSWMHPSMWVQHNRALSDAELVSLHADPMQIFRARRIFVPMASGPTYSLNQLSYRWRNDDGGETAATWAAAQGANP